MLCGQTPTPQCSPACVPVQHTHAVCPASRLCMAQLTLLSSIHLTLHEHASTTPIFSFQAVSEPSFFNPVARVPLLAIATRACSVSEPASQSGMPQPCWCTRLHCHPECSYASIHLLAVSSLNIPVAVESMPVFWESMPVILQLQPSSDRFAKYGCN